MSGLVRDPQPRYDLESIFLPVVGKLARLENVLFKAKNLLLHYQPVNYLFNGFWKFFYIENKILNFFWNKNSTLLVTANLFALGLTFLKN